MAPSRECISVIIPAINEESLIERCIESVRSEDERAQIIVADGGSADGTREVARAASARVIEAPRGRARQMNEGALAASGVVLLFLHADSRLVPGWRQALLEVLDSAGTAGGTFFPVFEPSTPVLKFYSLCARLPLISFRYGDQGIFLTRENFDRIGGYRDIPLMEDADLIRRMARLGRIRVAALPVVTSSRRFLERGPIKQELLNIALTAAWRLGADPEQLARRYPPPG